jgi:hypothetical protein
MIKSAKILRKVMVTIALMVLTVSLSYAQDTIRVTNSDAQMSRGMQSCYLVEIPQADLKSVEVGWIKKLQENIKVKVEETGPELILHHAVKSEISSDTLSIYSLIIQHENHISIHAFLEFDSVFFTPKKDETDLASMKLNQNIINYLRSFAVEQYREAVADELKEEEKILKSLENDLKKLEKDEENMIKDNASLENDIEEKERDVAELEQMIETTNNELTKHNVSMLSLEDDEAKDAAKDKQKELEKMKKDYEKSWSKAKDNISSYEAKIERNNQDIEESEEQQEAKRAEIEAQQGVIMQVQEKLDGMR